MDMHTFEARVKIEGVVRHIRIDAMNVIEARKLLEAQYGASNVVGVNPIQL